MIMIKKNIHFYHQRSSDYSKKNHYQHFQYGDKYWYFLLGILCLGLEGLHSLCKRRGEELKWVCPSIFIYLASIGKIPALKNLDLFTQYILAVFGMLRRSVDL